MKPQPSDYEIQISVHRTRLESPSSQIHSDVKYSLLKCYRKCVYIPKKCAETHSAFHINFCDVVDCNVLCGQSRFYIGSEWTATGANLLNHSWAGGGGGEEERTVITTFSSRLHFPT